MKKVYPIEEKKDYSDNTKLTEPWQTYFNPPRPAKLLIKRRLCFPIVISAPIVILKNEDKNLSYLLDELTTNKVLFRSGELRHEISEETEEDKKQLLKVFDFNIIYEITDVIRIYDWLKRQTEREMSYREYYTLYSFEKMARKKILENFFKDSDSINKYKEDVEESLFLERVKNTERPSKDLYVETLDFLFQDISLQIESLLNKVSLIIQKAEPLDENMCCYGILNEGPVLVAGLKYDMYSSYTPTHVYKLSKGTKCVPLVFYHSNTIAWSYGVASKNHLEHSKIFPVNNIFVAFLREDVVEVENEQKHVYYNYNTDFKVVQVKTFESKTRIRHVSKKLEIPKEARLYTSRTLPFHLNVMKEVSLLDISYPYSSNQDKNMSIFLNDWTFRPSDLYDNVNSKKVLIEKGLITNVEQLRKNWEWIYKQYAYFKSLSFRENYIVQGYTFHGDKIVNNVLRNSFVLQQDIDMSVFIFQIIDVFKGITKEELRQYTDDDVSVIKIKRKLLYFEKHKYLDLFPSQLKKLINLTKELLLTKLLNYAFVEKIVGLYVENLNKIIKESPLLEYPMTVYRGVKNDEWIRFDENKKYTTNGFWSTSVVLSAATRFTNQKDCCIHKIQIMPGAHCLGVFFASRYPGELEILLGSENTYTLTNSEVLKNLNMDEKDVQTKEFILF
jgi:hypothetical protein